MEVSMAKMEIDEVRTDGDFLNRGTFPASHSRPMGGSAAQRVRQHSSRGYLGFPPTHQSASSQSVSPFSLEGPLSSLRASPDTTPKNDDSLILSPVSNLSRSLSSTTFFPPSPTPDGATTASTTTTTKASAVSSSPFFASTPSSSSSGGFRPAKEQRLDRSITNQCLFTSTPASTSSSAPTGTSNLHFSTPANFAGVDPGPSSASSAAANVPSSSSSTASSGRDRLRTSARVRARSRVPSPGVAKKLFSLSGSLDDLPPTISSITTPGTVVSFRSPPSTPISSSSQHHHHHPLRQRSRSSRRLMADRSSGRALPMRARDPARKLERTTSKSEENDPKLGDSNSVASTFPLWDRRRGTSLKRTHAEMFSDDDREELLPVLLPAEASSCGRRNIVTHDTVARLLNGEFQAVKNYMIIDCRYPFEYTGGHIRGATSVSDTSMLEEIYQRDMPTDTVFIFHCEFSSRRGPRGLRCFRQLDRDSNTYPNVTFKELYLLKKGYSKFFEHHKELCTPQDYIPMRHPKFLSEVKREHKIDRRRKQAKAIRRTQSFSGFAIENGEIDVHDDDAFREHNSNFREYSLSTSNLFKSSPLPANPLRARTHKRVTSQDDMQVSYSPPKLCEMSQNSKRLYERSLLSVSSPSIFHPSRGVLDDSEESLDGASIRFDVESPATSVTSPSSESNSPVSNGLLFGNPRGRSRSPRARKKSFGTYKLYNFLSPPTSTDSSPSNSRSPSRSPSPYLFADSSEKSSELLNGSELSLADKLDRSAGDSVLDLRRSQSTPALLLSERYLSRETKRLKLSTELPSIEQMDKE